MKALRFFIFSLATILMLSACNNQKKPTPRQKVWGTSTDTTSVVKKVEVKGDKILVPFKRTPGDLVEIQASLNGEPVNFWWDSGASVTSISKLEFLKLMKAGVINESDFRRYAVATIADGTSVQEEVYRIKEIFILGQDREHYLRLEDIEVTVSESLAAPLLLGQNVIQLFPKNTLDDNNEVIIFDKQ